MTSEMVGANRLPVGIGDVVRVGDAGTRMLVVDLNSNGSMITVSWLDTRGVVFETTLKSAKLTVLRRSKKQ
jgi:uncharacterized protein YodC (DUF2158 family)